MPLFVVRQVAVVALLMPSLTGGTITHAQEPHGLIAHLPAAPASWQQLDQLDAGELETQFQFVLSDAWANVTWDNNDSAESRISKARQVFELNAETARRIEVLLPMRRAIGDAANSNEGRRLAAAYLRIMNAWNTFQGQLRFATKDYVLQMALSLPHNHVQSIIELALQHKVGVVAPALAHVLIEPPPGNKTLAFDEATRGLMLELIKSTRDVDIIASLHELIAWPHTPDGLLLGLVDALRTVGIHQTPRPDSGVLSIEEIHDKLQAIDSARLSAADRSRLADLSKWCTQVVKEGWIDGKFRWGLADLKTGDWILQRNPSPYNRFTDLSPGLFTHVGIVAEMENQKGANGYVIIDLPETGDRIKASTADAFVSKSLHWMVLRHNDAKIAAAMGDVAKRLCGRTAEFDLTFNTSLVQQQAGITESQAPVRTYCAGFLALCAQEAGVKRDSVFPFVERPFNEQCETNLKGLGLQIADFVSPSGPLFSSSFSIVGKRAPMHSPAREIKEAIYDRFAKRMTERTLTLRETSAQRIRQQLAELGSEYTWVRSALAKANNVNPAMDLVVAGRVATIVENLDAIADKRAEDFQDAFILIQTGDAAAFDSPTDVARLKRKLPQLKRQHASWFDDWNAGRFSTRTLRQLLVKHYISRGCEQVDSKFFE